MPCCVMGEIGVLRVMPVVLALAAAEARGLASPKSSSLAPDLVMTMFPGFRSR